jgi:hypothetical protein
VLAARRDTGAKETVAWGDLAVRVPQLLEEIQVRIWVDTGAMSIVASCGSPLNTKGTYGMEACMVMHARNGHHTALISICCLPNFHTKSQSVFDCG